MNSHPTVVLDYCEPHWTVTDPDGGRHQHLEQVNAIKQMNRIAREPGIQQVTTQAAMTAINALRPPVETGTDTLTVVLTQMLTCAQALPAALLEEKRLWTHATCATNTRIEICDRARAALASALTAGLPVTSAMNFCEKHGLISPEDIEHIRRSNSLGTLDTRMLPQFIRSKAHSIRPFSSAMAKTL